MMDVTSAHCNIMERTAPSSNRMSENPNACKPDIETHRGKQQPFLRYVGSEMIVIDHPRAVAIYSHKQDEETGGDDSQYQQRPESRVVDGGCQWIIVR